MDSSWGRRLMQTLAKTARGIRPKNAEKKDKSSQVQRQRAAPKNMLGGRPLMRRIAIDVLS